MQIEEGQSIPCPKKDRRKDNVLPHSKRNLTKKPRMKSGTLEGKVVPAPLQTHTVLILNDTLIQVILNIMQCFCSENTLCFVHVRGRRDRMVFGFIFYVSN